MTYFLLLFLLIINVQTAEQWNGLTAQSSGWLAADGVYSVVNPDNGKLYFWFSDTFCGTTQKDGREFKDVYMVNHSFWVKSKSQTVKTIVPKKDKNLLPDRYWLQDGFFLNGELNLTAMITNPKSWKPERLDWVSIPILPDGMPDFAHARIQKNVPLIARTEIGQLVYGGAILDTAPDGFLYIYGYLDSPRYGGRKDMIVARTSQNNVTDFDSWRFWDGQSWNPDIRASKPLVEGISCEFSVSPIPSGPEKGRFLVVYTKNCISPIVEYRVADSPVGPFSSPVTVYRAPEHKDGVSAYNAKAHPDLSTEEYVVISYNLNRLGHLPHNPMEYRPRFIRIRYEDVKR